MFDYSELNEYCRIALDDFFKENTEFMNNVIIKSFLEKENNKDLFITSICFPKSSSKEKLDAEFKKFYFNIRFTSFISNTLYFNAINYDKRYKKFSNRHPLTVDSSLVDGESSSFKDYIPDTKAEIRIDLLSKSSKVEDYVINQDLYEALKTLSPKQKEIIDMIYVKELSSLEICKLLGKTQQAVSKLHRKALELMYDYMTKRGGNSNEPYGNSSVDYDSR